MAMPDYEVWKLKGKPSDPDCKWHCLVPKNRPGHKTRDYAQGGSFYFGSVHKKKKLSKKLVSEGDFMVVDLTQKPIGVAHHIPRSLIRDGGVYYCSDDTAATLAWDLVISNAAPVQPSVSTGTAGTSTTGSTGSGGTSATGTTAASGGKGKGKAKAGSTSQIGASKPPTLPDQLKGLKAEKGALIALHIDQIGLPSKPLRDLADKRAKEKAKAKSKKKSSRPLPDTDEEDLLDRYRGRYVYYAIRGSDSTELDLEERVWNIVHEFKDEEETHKLSPKAYAKFLSDDRIDIMSRLSKSMDIDELAENLDELFVEIELADLDEFENKQLKQVRDRIKDIFEEAVPSALPGSSAILGAMNTAFGELQRQMEAGVRPEDIRIGNYNTTAGGLTQAGFENAGILVAIAFDIVRMRQLDTADDEPSVDTWKSVLTDLSDHLAKLTTGTTKLAELIASAVHGADSAMASGLGSWGGAGSAVIGYLNATRSSVQGLRTARRSQKVLHIKWSVARRKKGKPGETPELLNLTDFIFRKLDRRFNKQAITAMTGAIGATAGVIFALAAFGVINAWNPLGWTLLILSSAAGLGLVMYKSIRHFTKDKRREHRRGKSHPGTVDEFTDRTLAVMLDDTMSAEDRADACRLLQALVWKQFRTGKNAKRRRAFPVVRSIDQDIDGKGVVSYQILMKRPKKSNRDSRLFDDDIESFYEGAWIKDENHNWIKQEISAKTFRHVRALVKRHVKK